jgi:hypothetical protein
MILYLGNFPVKGSGGPISGMIPSSGTEFVPLPMKSFPEDRMAEGWKDRGDLSDVGQEPAVNDYGPEADDKLSPGKEAKNKDLIREYQAQGGVQNQEDTGNNG